jgi:SAM-dependent methyltransferase
MSGQAVARPETLGALWVVGALSPTHAMADMRTAARVRAHYDAEVELANRLREAPPHVRRGLYGRVYDELFARVPDHPQLTRRADPNEQKAYASQQVSLIRQFVPRGGTYVEIGAGDCATVRLVAEFAGSVTAVEVSGEIVPDELPPNVEVAISDGVSVPVHEGRADLVYSNQLMEHLHPDDAMEQLRNIAMALKPGGRYISSGFDEVARGFHLHEYTHGELGRALRDAGFHRVRKLEQAHGRAFSRFVQALRTVHASAAQIVERAGGRAVVVPLAPYLLVERVAAIWPGRVSDARLFRRLLDIRVIAER